MIVNSLKFGTIIIDGVRIDHDVVIDESGNIEKRSKKKSKKYRDEFGHTPLSVNENIPWNCRRLVIGSGHSGVLPVMSEVNEKAAEMGVELVILRTPEAVKQFGKPDTNFILHLTC